MKETYFITSLTIALALNCNAQNFSWVKTIYATTTHDCGTQAVVSDAQNNVLSTGYYTGNTISSGVSLSGSGTPDVFVTKHDPSGNLLWTYNTNTQTSGGAISTDIEVAPDGSIIVVGYFGTAAFTDFNPGLPGGELTSGTYDDVFILKLNNDGSFNWVKKVGGYGVQDMPNNVRVDSNGNIYVVGKFNGMGNYSTNGGTITLTSSGDYDGFVLKLDSQGNSLWANQIGGSTYDEVKDLTIKGNGNISCVGYFTGSVDFDPSSNQSVITSNSGSSDGFLIEYTTTGGLSNIWTFGSSGTDRGISIDSDENDRLYISGIFTGTVDFNPSNGTYNLTSSSTSASFQMALDQNSNLVFANTFSSTYGGLPQKIIVKGSRVYLTGSFYGSTDFDPNTNVAFTMSTNPNIEDIYLCILDLVGNFISAYELNSGSQILRPSDLFVDNANSILLTGDVKGTLDVDPGPNTVNVSSFPQYAGYTVKLLDNCVITSSTISTSTCGSYTAPDGQIYTQSGSYSATIPNALGCDSVITINLTLTQPTSSTISPASCLTYTAPDGQVYTQSGNYTATIPNASGCDSTITINLTIHQNSSSTIAPSACGNYISPDGQTYTQSGTYSATIPNAFGCDSVITINLTIQNIDTGVSLNVNTLTANATGLQYQWIDCATNQPVSGATQQSFTPTYNGSFAVIVTNGNCSDTTSCTSVSHVSLNELSQGALSVQPNPTNGIVTINGLNPSVQNRIILYTISGEVLTEMMTTESEVQLNLELYAPGMYFINCDGEVFRVVKK